MVWDLLSYFNLAEIYLSTPYLWDSLILLALFLGITQHVFVRESRYGKKQGKIISIAISLALTFSATTFLYAQGWNLAHPAISIIPLVIIFAVFFILLYDVFMNLLGMEKMCAASLAFLIAYPGIQAMFGNPHGRIVAEQPLLGLLLVVLLIVAVISLFTCLAKLLPSPKKLASSKPDAKKKQSTSQSKKPTPQKNPKSKEATEELLSIEIDEPRYEEYKLEDKQIPASCTIQGGSGKYNWFIIFTGKGTEQTIKPYIVEKGSGSQAQASIKNPGPGKWTFAFIAKDKKNSSNEKEETKQFIIRPPKKTDSSEESDDQKSSSQPTTKQQDKELHPRIHGHVFIKQLGAEKQERIAPGAKLYLVHHATPGEETVVKTGLSARKSDTAPTGFYEFTAFPRIPAEYSIHGEYTDKDGVVYRGEIDPTRGGYANFKREHQTHIVLTKNNLQQEANLVLTPVSAPKQKTKNEEKSSTSSKQTTPRKENKQPAQDTEDEEKASSKQTKKDPTPAQKPAKKESSSQNKEPAAKKQKKKSVVTLTPLQYKNFEAKKQERFRSYNDNEALGRFNRITASLVGHHNIEFSIQTQGASEGMRYIYQTHLFYAEQQGSHWLTADQLEALEMEFFHTKHGAEHADALPVHPVRTDKTLVYETLPINATKDARRFTVSFLYDQNKHNNTDTYDFLTKQQAPPANQLCLRVTAYLVPDVEQADVQDAISSSTASILFERPTPQ